MKKEHRIDISHREKDYTAKVGIHQLPVHVNDITNYFKMLEMVEQRQDLNTVLQLPEGYQPQSVLISYTGQGYYMELSYPMDDFEWTHPLLLANDNLTIKEAADVLWFLLVEGTDEIEIITNHFHEISSRIYED